MRDITQLTYHPIAQKIVDVIKTRMGNDEDHYFHCLAAYYFSKVATTMRCMVNPPGGQLVPPNTYAFLFAPSGFGKTKAVNVFEDEVVKLFQSRFTEETLPALAEDAIYADAVRIAQRQGEDPDTKVEARRAHYEAQGEYLFSFDSGSTPAMKQLRHKCLMAKAGSLNLEIDEIGANFTSSQELLTSYLEMFDIGKIRNKLTKDGSDKNSKRNGDIAGLVPANLLGFGTPTRVFDGGATEDAWNQNAEQGYGRRPLFAYVPKVARNQRTAQEELDAMKNTASNGYLSQLMFHFEKLADQVNYNREIIMQDAVALHWLDYKHDCIRRAAELPEHATVRKAEILDRYWKALKIAGAYAFIDGDFEISEDNLYHAIHLAEQSGKALEKLSKRDSPYIKLAKYLASAEAPKTQWEMVEELPFFSGSAQRRADLLSLAISWGYKNNVIIKKSFDDGVELVSADALEQTNIDKMIFSYSTDLAFNYENQEQPFKNLHILTQSKRGPRDMHHFINHHVDNGHRTEDTCRKGFNFIVLDVDGGVSIDTAKLLLRQYTYLLYTTKSHDPNGEHRFRVILPINYVLKLDKSDFKAFLNGLYDDLPFDVDRSADHRAKKWEANNGTYEYNYGELFDVLPYIPKTSGNEKREAANQELRNLSAAERWFIDRTGEGNRSNQLIKYAMMLVDAGHDFAQIDTAVRELNRKLPSKLDDDEIQTTIMRTVTRKLIKRDKGA